MEQGQERKEKHLGMEQRINIRLVEVIEKDGERRRAEERCNDGESREDPARDTGPIDGKMKYSVRFSHLAQIPPSPTKKKVHMTRESGRKERETYLLEKIVDVGGL